MDYRLFSADDHVDLRYLPSDLWESRVPAAYRKRAPHVEETPEGRRWMADGEPYGGLLGKMPSRGVKRDYAFGRTYTPVEHEEGHWRPTTPELRLADMDRDGVEGQVLYGPFVLFQLKDPDLNVVSIRAFNDWMAEFSKASPKRLVGIGALPVHDVLAAVSELRRCAKLGLKGVQFQAFVACKFPWEEAWEPLWATAADTGVSISVHQAGGNWSTKLEMTGSSPFGPAGRGRHATNQVTEASRVDEVLVGLILAGVIKRHPKLRVVLAEGGIGWIPYVLTRMDRIYQDRHAKKQDDAADLDMLPSEYFKQRMHATFQDDPVRIRLMDLIGANTLLWGSDYPHSDSTWPYSQKVVSELFQGLDPPVTRRITRDNARELYT